MNPSFSIFTAFALVVSSIPGMGHAESMDVVSSGELRFSGKPWETTTESFKGLTAEGAGRFLFAKQEMGEGDFSIRAKLLLERIDGSAASLELGGSRVGFDGKGGSVFVEGPLFKGKPGIVGKPGTLVKPGVPFVMEVIRKAGEARFIIDGREFHRIESWNAPAGRVGLRPWRNRMTVAEFTIDGNLIAPQAVPPPLFKSGEAGYHTYRIPSLAVTPKGTLLAICEGRKNSSGDSGDIDLLVKRSTDQGKTWSEAHVIWDDVANTCGNPCVVVDEVTGSIILSATWNLGEDHEREIIAGKSKDTRRVFVMQSDDDGLAWSKPREITESVKKPNWTWYATGPGSGIQVKHGAHKGRLVIACDHIESASKQYYSHVIFSDDHGATWNLGGRTPEHQVNECDVVELTGGRLMLNMRNYQRSERTRQIAISDDGGMTWKDQKHDPVLIEPICEAAIHRHSWPEGGKRGVVLFSNPASTEGRVRMTVRASFDDAATWPVSKLLYEGPASYSDLCSLSDGRFACLYEAGESNISESIVFTTLSMADLTDDPDHNH